MQGVMSLLCQSASLPLVCRYGSPTSSGTGSGVTIYVIDSGIKATHQEFRKADGSGSRASYGEPGPEIPLITVPTPQVLPSMHLLFQFNFFVFQFSGYDFVNDNSSAEDCDGHGTHVAGTAAGIQVGVAKDANIVAVRILDCQGSGTISNTVAALDWVAANAQKPAVATLSLGIQVGSWSRVLEDAVRSLVVNHGITVVVASGNSGVDACYVAPADVPEVITVGATDVDTKYSGTNQGDKETMYRWSNTGPCLDIFGPGVDSKSPAQPCPCLALHRTKCTLSLAASSALQRKMY